MKRIKIKTKVKGCPTKIIRHFDEELFMKLNPPFIKVELNQFDGCKKDSDLKLTTNFLGLYQYWHNKVIDRFDSDNLVYFIDEGVEMPFPITKWIHKHKIVKIDDQNSYIVDDIEYICSNPIFEFFSYPAIFITMFYRKPIYVDVFNNLEE